jgi:hypothetical protein
VKAAPPWQSTAMQGAGPLFLSIMMIAAFLLTWGGIYLIVKRRDRKKGTLMLIAAAVAVGNVLVWTL